MVSSNMTGCAAEPRTSAVAIMTTTTSSSWSLSIGAISGREESMFGSFVWPGSRSSFSAKRTPGGLASWAARSRLRQGGRTPAPLDAAALLLPAAAWRWRRILVLLLAARSSRTAKPERLLAAGALAWQGLAARYGQPPTGVTCREYAASLHIDDARLRESVWQLVRQWETLAYSPVPASVRTLAPAPARSPAPASVQKPSTAQSLSDSESAAGFIRVCLGITFRLT